MRASVKAFVEANIHPRKLPWEAEINVRRYGPDVEKVPGRVFPLGASTARISNQEGMRFLGANASPM